MNDSNFIEKGSVKKDAILLSAREIEDCQRCAIVGVVPVDAKYCVALPCPLCLLKGGKGGVKKLKTAYEKFLTTQSSRHREDFGAQARKYVEVYSLRTVFLWRLLPPAVSFYAHAPGMRCHGTLWLRPLTFAFS